MNAGELRKGKYLEIDNNVFYVVDYMQTKQARGASIIKTKLKNVETGNVMEKKFNATEKVNIINLDRRQMQYLYNDSENFYFMDLETYEQMSVNKIIVDDVKYYLKDETVVEMHFNKNKILAVIPPLFINLKVTVCELGLQGDSSRAGTKPAQVETGLELKVPLFVERGDTIKVDTRTGEYVERV